MWSLWRDGDLGRRHLARNTPACVGKVSGWAGRQAGPSAGMGFFPTSPSFPALPPSTGSRTSCRGLSGLRQRARDGRCAPGEGGRPTSLRDPWRSRPPCPLASSEPARSPEALASSRAGVRLRSLGLGARPRALGSHLLPAHRWAGREGRGRRQTGVAPRPPLPSPDRRLLMRGSSWRPQAVHGLD